MARPSKLPPADVLKRICKEIRTTGLPHKRAAAIVGVDEGTFSRWYRAGAADDAPKRLREFRAAIYAAEAELQKKWLADIGDGPGAKLKLLRSRFPEEWGRRDNAPPDDAETKASDAAVARQALLERLEKILRVQKTPPIAAEPPPAPAPPPPSEGE